MRIKMLVLAIIVLMAFPFRGVAFPGNDIIIIANKSVPVTSLSSDDIKNIFLANKTDWGDGKKIDFVILKDCDTHEKLLKKYINKTPSQFQRYFRSLVFTGKGKSPRSFKSEKDLVSYVAGADGAIGYISSSTDKGDAIIIDVK